MVATGDRLPLNPHNQPVLHSLGKVVLFYGTPALVHNRIQKKKNKSILGKNLSLEQISEIIQQRQPVYQEVADIVVAVDGCSMEEIAAQVLIQLQP